MLLMRHKGSVQLFDDFNFAFSGFCFFYRRGHRECAEDTEETIKSSSALCASSVISALEI